MWVQQIEIVGLKCKAKSSQVRIGVKKQTLTKLDASRVKPRFEFSKTESRKTKIVCYFEKSR